MLLVFFVRYYPALKTLEQLEHTYLPRVISHWFSQTMAEAIPKLREQIKEASMIELKDFLESIRKHSTRIGEVAMKHVSKQDMLRHSRSCAFMDFTSYRFVNILSNIE